MSRKFHRRELLIAMLGLPAVLAGCQGGDPPEPEFSGRIVGPSLEMGHRLRDGWQATPAADAWETTGVVIVGGGVAGLSAAWRLRKAGEEDFVLLELENQAGGTARGGASPPGVSAVTAFPWGAHYVPAPTHRHPALIRLFDELGLFEGKDEDGDPIVAEQFVCRDPEERIFHGGRWYEGLYLHAGATADDLAQRRRFDAQIDRWAGWRDGGDRPAFAIPTAAASDDAELAALDKLSMADWIARQGFTSPRLRWLVDYSCRDDYGLTAEQTSAWAGLFYFAARLPEPGGEERPLITWPGGNSRLVEHLTGGLARQLRPGMTTLEMIPRDGPKDAAGVDVVAVGRDGVARGFHARRAIFAAPQFIARYVIRPYREAPPAHLDSFQYGSWFVANLFLRDRPAERGFPLAWDNVLYDSPSLGYVCATHQNGPEAGPTVLTYYYPLCDSRPRRARQKLFDMDWRDCVNVTLADLGRAHPDLRPLIERVDVMRWGHAMIRPTPGFMFRADRRRAAKPFRGIHFANTDLSGVALFEEAFYHGVRAAEEVLSARGRKTASFL